MQGPPACGHVPTLTIPTPIYGQIDKGVNMKRKSGVESRKRFYGNPAIILSAPAAELLPNVVHRILWTTPARPRGGF